MAKCIHSLELGQALASVGVDFLIRFAAGNLRNMAVLERFFENAPEKTDPLKDL